MMRLWTFQPPTVLEDLRNGCSFCCNPLLSEQIQDFPDFRRSYDWMVKSMEARLTASQRPAGVSYPVWAWYVSYDAHRRPDRRFRMFNNCREQSLIEIEVSEDRVLLSDFDDWHCVLNNFPILPESFYENEESNGRGPYDLVDAMTREEVETTWESIFDVQGKAFIQACLWEIRPEDIVRCW